MSRARKLGLALQARMSEVAHLDGPAPSSLGLFGVGQAQVMHALDQLERTSRRSALSLHPILIFDPDDAGYELHARSTGRGLHLEMITPPRTLLFNPLLTSLNPNARLGPVVLRCIVVDGDKAIIGGPDTTEGETTAWLTTDGEFLERAIELWDTTLAESRPALPEGEAPPLNVRQVAVARCICLGQTDAAIGRSLGISERTVARDVARILEVTLARSRAEAVLNMLGRGRHSR